MYLVGTLNMVVALEVDVFHECSHVDEVEDNEVRIGIMYQGLQSCHNVQRMKSINQSDKFTNETASCTSHKD